MSARSPLSYPVYRGLWLAGIVTFIGSFVQNVGEAWLMLDLTKSPLPVAMLSTAFVGASLFMMLPAGVLADRFNRRSVLIVSQVVQAVAAITMALLSFTGRITPEALIAGVVVLGLGMALGAPAWASLIPDLVPRELIAEAVALNAVSFNIARAVGPAIGGVVLARFGATTAFLLNAGTFVVVIVALVVYKKGDDEHEPVASVRPLSSTFAEPFASLRNDANLRSPLLAMSGFAFGASIFYPLAPPFAKNELGASALAFGLMVGAMGVGAVIGAVVLKRLRKVLSPRLLVTGTMLTFAGCAVAISRAPSIASAMILFVPAGVGWMGSFSSLAALVQVWAPARLRARAVAIYQLVHLATWAVGSSLGGSLADHFGVRTAMATGALACTAAAFLTLRIRLPKDFHG